MGELKRLVRLRRVTCRRSGTDRYGRFLGSCLAHPILWGSKVDLSAAMVSSGQAVVYRQDQLRSANDVQYAKQVVSGKCYSPKIPRACSCNAAPAWVSSPLQSSQALNSILLLCCQSHIVWKVTNAGSSCAQALQRQRPC